MAQDHAALVRRMIEEVWNKGKLALCDELVSPSFVRRDPSTPGEARGPKGIKEVIGAYRAAFPDLAMTLDEVIVQGDKVAARGTAHGTHKGPLMGIPPTGKTGSVTWMTISRIANGKIEEERANWDALGLLQQLGIVPRMTS
jgi:steroid delta-isomerase-like uncharacterized protein